MDDWAGYRVERNALGEEFKSNLVQHGERNRENKSLPGTYKNNTMYNY
jgi:hypothetical protein